MGVRGGSGSGGGNGTYSSGEQCTGANSYGNVTDGDTNYVPNKGFYALDGTIYGKIILEGSSNVEFTLQKRKYALAWDDVASSTDTGFTKALNANISTGVYRWKVQSYAGDAQYAICSHIP